MTFLRTEGQNSVLVSINGITFHLPRKLLDMGKFVYIKLLLMLF